MRQDERPLDIYDDLQAADGTAKAPRSWKILVVDDDEDVHRATKFALRGITILDRPIELFFAASRSEAQAAIATLDDIAVALIDVVMETQDAGLKLVEDLRGAGLGDMRIVLRTGYPGYAPEVAVATNYEIDDYHTKEELTRTRLITVLTTAIRAYDRIRAISKSRKGLEQIIESARQIFQRTSLELFAQGVLTQIAALLRLEPSGFVSIQPGDGTEMKVILGIGSFCALTGANLADTGEAITRLFESHRNSDEPVFNDGYMGLHFRNENGREMFAVLETEGTFDSEDLDLLRLFSSNISIGFKNLALIEALDRLAFHDSVLDLPNQNAFEQALAQAIARGSNGQVIEIKVSAFQPLVAAFGRSTAIRLMQKAYERLDRLGHGHCRISLVAEGALGVIDEEKRMTPEGLAETMNRPYRIDDVELAPQPTSVIVPLSQLPADPVQASRSAAAAFVHVRQNNKGQHVIYDAAQHQAVLRQQMLQMALKDHTRTFAGFAVFLQPKVDLESRSICGAEALLRWTMAGQTVSPAEFIPIAETIGLTRPLTEFVLTQVAEWVGRRRAAGLRLTPVAVNLSMADLNIPGFAEWLIATVQALGLSPDLLEFEVTEAVAMHETVATQQIEQLSADGFRISLDDFGTGYSSLGYFDSLPISTIKIDRRFIGKLTVESAYQNLSAVIVAMTERLGVNCVAEGIETEEQLEALKLLGCRIGQGYLFGRPEPIDSFSRRIDMPG
ncbi:EAL domain-containing protein [Martelella alba]|uniref:EAL domain-containing protein n=1 Tax=Martelella alba TaxID=2590451 RepID=A0A506U8K5_9HYPH|nr:EAL domain-containing protein [Martelella alba]TPW28899.1 EAL domain-containing protein [Martelella alba]